VGAPFVILGRTYGGAGCGSGLGFLGPVEVNPLCDDESLCCLEDLLERGSGI
jgi:hypothetical protein